MEEKQIRIQFYGEPNMMIGFYLSKAEELLNSITPQTSVSDINEAVEYYNVIRYFDKGIYLKTWDNHTIQLYKERVNVLRRIVGKRFGSIDRAVFTDTYNSVERQLRGDYIDAIEYYGIYRKLQSEDIALLFSTNPSSIRHVILHRKIVNTFGRQIIDYLLTAPSAAEILIDHYFVKHHSNKKETYIPTELTQNDFERILLNYIEWSEANPNYLKVIAGLKKSDSFFVKDRIRLKALRRYRERIALLFKGNDTSPTEYGVNVQFQNQSAISSFEIDNNILKLSYSIEWIDENLDYATLMNNFIYLFGFTDNRMRCRFLSNPAKMGILESEIGLKAKRDYPTGIDYSINYMQSQLQMMAYRSELIKHNIEVESLFKWFFEEYLDTEFGAKGYTYCTPTSTASDLEKILVMITQFDSVLKQFRLFIEDEMVDRELFELSSLPYRIVATPSMLKDKYIYGKSEELAKAQFLLFSDQSGLTYTEKTGSKASSFKDILVHHNVGLADYPEFEHYKIQWLLDKGYINLDEANYLRAKKPITNLLYELYNEGSIAYFYCNDIQKEVIGTMLEKGDVEMESSLFTRREQEYLDYMLNTQEFINGPELRNKYVHGTFSTSAETHKRDYVELLKIMVLIIIKINEEFCLKYPEKKVLS